MRGRFIGTHIEPLDNILLLGPYNSARSERTFIQICMVLSATSDYPVKGAIHVIDRLSMMKLMSIFKVAVSLLYYINLLYILVNRKSPQGKKSKPI